MTRENDIEKFLSSTPAAGLSPVPMREDASARRYFRLTGKNASFVLMDAAPPFEEVGEFCDKAKIFSQYQWRVPKIFAEDRTKGLLLLEDLGDESFGDARKKGLPQQPLYQDAIAALIHLHAQSSAEAKKLPKLSDARLLYHASWMIEWYIPLVQPQTLSRTIRERFLELWTEAFQHLNAVPWHATHLDYQFHNLMRLHGNTAVARCGILDFQDACFGPIVSDLVLLLQDAREDVAPAIVESGINQYLSSFPSIAKADFDKCFAIFSALNAARIVGVFARLKMRDKKPQYLQHIPRNLRYLESSLQHPALAKIKDWFDTHVPSEKRLAIPELKVA